jgi:ribonuclease III family protein
MLDKIANFDCIKDDDLGQLSSLSLAFLGDAVWGVLVRQFFVDHSTYKNNLLHKLSTKFVKATYQSTFLEKIDNFLNDDERAVCKRARNAHVATVAKNAGLADYKRATALEALIGFLYLKKDFDKISLIYEKLKEDMTKALEGEKR